MLLLSFGTLLPQLYYILLYIDTMFSGRGVALEPVGTLLPRPTLDGPQLIVALECLVTEWRRLSHHNMRPVSMHSYHLDSKVADTYSSYYCHWPFVVIALGRVIATLFDSSAAAVVNCGF